MRDEDKGHRSNGGAKNPEEGIDAVVEGPERMEQGSEGENKEGEEKAIIWTAHTRGEIKGGGGCFLYCIRLQRILELPQRKIRQRACRRLFQKKLL